MIEINAAQLPDKLLQIEIGPKLAGGNCLFCSLRKESSPMFFHRKQALPNRILKWNVIELEEAGSDRAAPLKARLRCPAKPAVNDLSQSFKTGRLAHSRLDKGGGSSSKHLF